jgi:hypothetical protein
MQNAHVLLRDPFVGITIGVKMPVFIIGLICRYCNGCKMPLFILGLITVIAYLKMALWNV